MTRILLVLCLDIILKQEKDNKHFDAKQFSLELRKRTTVAGYQEILDSSVLDILSNLRVSDLLAISEL